MKETVLVFGGTSFIGMNLIRRLIASGYDVVTTYRPRSAKYEKLYAMFQNKIQYVEVDLCNMQTSIKNLETLDRCDYLYLASWEGTNARDDEMVNERSANGLLQGLQYILDRFACKKVIQLGTQAEYGCPAGIVTEETACNPRSAYGKEKWRFYKMAEILCKQKNTNFIEYRIHSVFGKFRGGVLDSVISQLKINKYCYMDTDCSQIFDYLYIHDCIDAL